jgi:hypothetical protein
VTAGVLVGGGGAHSRCSFGLLIGFGRPDPIL